MRYLIAAACLVCLWVGGVDARQEGARHYVAAPPEYALLAVAAQPDSPLQVENAQLLLGADGRPAVSCQLRNRGSKAIRSYQLAMWNTHATGGTVGPPSAGPDGLLMGGEVVSHGPPGAITTLTEELRRKLKLVGPMKGVFVLMVERVEFADGSTYNAQPTSDALIAYFESLVK